jgi:hypothetical protein
VVHGQHILQILPTAVFKWGNLKDRVYRMEPHTEELKHAKRHFVKLLRRTFGRIPACVSGSNFFFLAIFEDICIKITGGSQRRDLSFKLYIMYPVQLGVELATTRNA